MKYIILILVFLLIPLATATDYYYNQSGGNDSNDCSTPALSCKTIVDLNTKSLSASDNVYFARGEVWRCSIDAYIDVVSGSSSGFVTYGAYGTGEKPEFLGSWNASNSSDWIDMGSNVWMYNKTLSWDIGSIIFNNGASWCDMKTSTEGLVNQNDCYWNSADYYVRLYSVSNPGTYYSDVEISYSYAASNPEGLIDFTSKSYVIFEDLSLKYGGIMGFNGANSHDITIRNCDISYMGGHNGGVRYGGAIQFGLGGYNINVSGNNISYSWDACITAQSWDTGSGKTMINQYYGYNICLYSPELFEWFQSVADSGTNTGNIIIEHNTVAFGTNQESTAWCSTRGGRDLRLARTPAETDNFVVRNNIFYDNKRQWIDLGSSSSTKWLGEITLNNNLYYSNYSLSTPIAFNGTNYATLTSFQTATEQENNGQQTNPLFLSTDPSSPDFLIPASNSPACTMSSTGSYVGALPCETEVVTNISCVGVKYGCVGSVCSYNNSVCLEESTYRTGTIVCIRGVCT